MRFCFSIVMTLLLGVGCGKPSDGIQVTGTVKNTDGSDLKFESGMAVFQSPSDPTQFASGEIKSDGSFELMSKKPGDGVKPGAYKVVLQIYKSYSDQIMAIPDKYTDSATTPLEAAIDADHTRFDFKIEPK